VRTVPRTRIPSLALLMVRFAVSPADRRLGPSDLLVIM
jgi:hypothetical protein